MGSQAIIDSIFHLQVDPVPVKVPYDWSPHKDFTGAVEFPSLDESIFHLNVPAMSPEDIDDATEKHSDGFDPIDIRSIGEILKKLAPSLSGTFGSWGSGGGNYHMGFQTKAGFWIMFHTSTGDTTVSNRPYATADALWNAFSDDIEQEYTVAYEGTFHDVNAIVDRIKQIFR